MTSVTKIKITVNKEVIVVSNIRIQWFADYICEILNRRFTRIKTAVHKLLATYLRRFISKKRASVSDKTSSPLNNLKGILFRIKSTMLPPRKSLSNMNGFSRPGKRNWSKGNVSSIFVSGRSRTSILSDTIEVSNSDLLLAELIFH